MSCNTKAIALVGVLTLGACALPTQPPRDQSVASVNTAANSLHGQRVSVIGHGAYSYNHAELWGDFGMRMHGAGEARARECLVLRGPLADRDAFGSRAPRYRIVGRVYVDKALDQPVACNSPNILVPESIEPLDFRTPVPRP